MFSCDDCGIIDYVVLDGLDLGYEHIEGIEFVIKIIDGELSVTFDLQADKALSQIYEDDLREFIAAAEDYAEITEYFYCPNCHSHVERPHHV